MLGAQLEGLLGRLGLGLAALTALVVPLALVWLALGIWLGRTQERLAEAGDMPPTTKRRPLP